MNAIEKNPFLDSELTTILVVENIDASKEFYVDKLGSKIFREYAGNSLVIEFLGSWLLLVTPGGPTSDKPGVSYVPVSDPNAVNHSFTIRVRNCEYAYEVLTARGVDFITPPHKRGAETRCFFRDPDGHLFEISAYQPGE